MRKRRLIPIIAILLAAASGCSQSQQLAKPEPAATTAQSKPAANADLVLIKGGAFKNTKSGYYGTEIAVADFYISRFEVTQQEWADVMGDRPSAFQGERLPVENVSWYDAIEYCNRRSVKEGLQPYYDIDRNRKDPDNHSDNDPLKWTVKIRAGADGYRLPTETEWEYAAGGGALSRSFAYSGSDDVDEAAWNWRNAGDRPLSGTWNWPAIENNRTHTHAVGGKKPNELGLYDMSGNVREWCWDWYEDPNLGSGLFRTVRGGGWIGDVGSIETAYRGKFEASGFGPDQGFRVSRDAEPER